MNKMYNLIVKQRVLASAKSLYRLAMLAFLMMVGLSQTIAREIQGMQKPVAKTAGPNDCVIPTTKTNLDVNNVRTTLLTAGDMWWDLKNAKYEIPKDKGVSSIFAGALWFGAMDPDGNLKVAAQTYRQNGSDFWSGPLENNGTVTKATCAAFDKHWKVNRDEVKQFANGLIDPTPDMISWPANGNVNSVAPINRDLAPFEDVDGDMMYDVNANDYPRFNIKGLKLGKKTSKDYLLGDQVLWWVFNDKGNTHTESDSQQAIGLEIQAMGFGFKAASDDPISNMTFYRYKIINRSSSDLSKTYIGQWVDSDLGYAFDDYVGCDVAEV